MISKFKEKFSRKNIKSVALKSATAISGGVAVLASHASAAINTAAITESTSAITSILPAMGDWFLLLCLLAIPGSAWETTFEDHSDEASQWGTEGTGSGFAFPILCIVRISISKLL